MALGVLDVSVSRRLMLDEDQPSIPAGCLKAFDTWPLADWGQRWPLTPT